MRRHSTTLLLGVALLASRAAMAQVRIVRPNGSGGVSVSTTAAMRDSAPEPTGTASLRGRVVAVETGAPLRNVQVRLSGGGFRTGPVVGTDAEGRYAFDRLPAGRFTLTAEKTGLVTLSYGQRRPFEAGRPLELTSGQMLENVDFALPRGGVVAVRVTDEFGDPMSGVRVQALRYRFQSGQRQLASVGSGAGGPTGGTDDRGEIRLYGLPPGEYFISASGGGMFAPIGAADTGRSYVTSYYPGTASIAQAQKVEVRVGREVSVSLPLTASRLARIRAVVRGSDGGPLKDDAEVSLSYLTGTGGFGTRGIGKQPDGSFSIADLPPGEYTINVSPPYTDRSGTGEYASVPVKVDGEDITGLTITTGKAGRLRGRLVFDTPATPDLRPVSMQPTFVPISGNFSLSGRATVNENSTFEVIGLVEAGFIRLSTQVQGWYLKAVLLNDKDVTDTPLDFSGGKEINDLQLIVTRTRSEITGVVRDERNAPVADYVAVVFPEARDQWTTHSRFLASGRPDQQGAFKITGLPPGRYLAAAVDYLETGSEGDPDVLERLKTSAIAVVVGEGESKPVTLKLVTF